MAELDHNSTSLTQSSCLSSKGTKVNKVWQDSITTWHPWLNCLNSKGTKVNKSGRPQCTSELLGWVKSKNYASAAPNTAWIVEMCNIPMSVKPSLVLYALYRCTNIKFQQMSTCWRKLGHSSQGVFNIYMNVNVSVLPLYLQCLVT